MSKQLLLFLLTIPVLLHTGCSGQGTGVSMSGRVTLDGQPLAKGTIQVLPAAGSGQAAGSEISQGEFRIANAPAGRVTIMLIATRETGRMYDDNGTQRPELENAIPVAARGGFERENKPGENRHDIELKTSP